MPDQDAYDRALAVAQLVLGRIYPACLGSLHKPPTDLHLLLPIPPPLTAGLRTPLPPSLTGEGRSIDLDEILVKGLDALEALQVLLEETDRALGAS